MVLRGKSADGYGMGHQTSLSQDDFCASLMATEKLNKLFVIGASQIERERVGTGQCQEKTQGMSSLCTHIWREALSHWCSETEQEAIGTNRKIGGFLWTSGNTIPLLGWLSTGTGSSGKVEDIFGDILKLPKTGPGHLAMGHHSWAAGMNQRISRGPFEP